MVNTLCQRFVLAYCYCHFLVRLSNPLSRPKHQRIKTNSKPSNRISLKKKKVFSNKKQRSSLLDQLKQQENTISQTSRSLRETQATLAELSKDIASLTTSIEKLQNQQSQQQSILSKQLAAAFKQGKHSSLQLILSGEESQRSERILAYFSYLNEARQKAIEELKQTRTTLSAEKKCWSKNRINTRHCWMNRKRNNRSWNKRVLPAKNPDIAGSLAGERSAEFGGVKVERKPFT